MNRCEMCNSPVVPKGECPSCLAYNAACFAQKAAAREIARAFDARATSAWLNAYGVFAWLRGKAVQFASPEMAAPFVALTAAARAISFPHGHCWQTDGEPVKEDA